MVSKSSLREHYIALRKALPASERVHKAHEICLQLRAHRWYLDARVICCYIPMGAEVDTAEIREAIQSDGKVLLTPEALEGQHAQVDVDLFIVPGVAFSSDGKRLGRGEGWYDRLLVQFPHAKRIGISFVEQLCEELPWEAHDQTMDLVLFA